jgi:hypothetical protein
MNPSSTDRASLGVALLLALAAALSLAIICSGCLYKGAKVVEGTDIAVGLSVPGTEETLQINALNYLSGFRLGIAENAALTLRYSCATTNSYFGVVHSETVKSIDATVSPCEVSPVATNAVEEVASE